MSDKRRQGLCLITHHSSLFSAVDVEQDADDDDEQRFELEEVLQVEAAVVVTGDGVDRERAEEEADRQPDDLTLPVPHRFESRESGVASQGKSGFDSRLQTPDSRLLFEFLKSLGRRL